MWASYDIVRGGETGPRTFAPVGNTTGFVGERVRNLRVLPKQVAEFATTFEQDLGRALCSLEPNEYVEVWPSVLLDLVQQLRLAQACRPVSPDAYTCELERRLTEANDFVDGYMTTIRDVNRILGGSAQDGEPNGDLRGVATGVMVRLENRERELAVLKAWAETSVTLIEKAQKSLWGVVATAPVTAPKA